MVFFKHSINTNYAVLQNRKSAGAPFLPIFYQICLPYVPCRFSPPEMEPQVFLGHFTTFAVLVPQIATVLMKIAEPHLTCFQSVEVSDVCGLLSKGAGKVKSLVKATISFLRPVGKKIITQL